MVQLHLASTIPQLVEGDLAEHLALEAIPLQGDVLGLGTTAGLENGELAFLPDPGAPAATRVYKSQPQDGRVLALTPGDGLQHFPFVCFSDDATSLRHPVDPTRLAALEGGLQERLGQLIDQLCDEGSLPQAPLYGIRLLSRWRSLLITVSSRLCLGQLNRNTAVARRDSTHASGQNVGETIYTRLPHFLVSAEDPGDAEDPVRWLGASPLWECCGFWDREPLQGRVTLPEEGAHLHLHGCSADLRFGGHLQHQDPLSQLISLERLVLYPLAELHWMGADPAIEALTYTGGLLHITVANLGQLDASELDVVVVIDDRWSGHQHLRLPWLAAGARESFTMLLELGAGRHEIAVVVDPEALIPQPRGTRANNRRVITVG
jgi:hypothetical protein